MGEKSIKKNLSYFYFWESMIVGAWGIYLFKFISFYREAYFYVDKRLSLFFQMLSFLNNNWNESFIYFILAFLLITFTLFFSYFLYITYKKGLIQNKLILFFVYLNLLFCLSLLVNVCFLIFFVLLILSGSLVYIIFTFVNLNTDKEHFDYLEGNIIDIKGPFITEVEAETAMKVFLSSWKEEKIILGEEIYKDQDDKYYVDIYIEAINK